jgi:hypothetical protein
MQKNRLEAFWCPLCGSSLIAASSEPCKNTVREPNGSDTLQAAAGIGGGDGT